MSELSKLQQIANNSDVLFRVKTMFPFQIFPGYLTIKPARVEYAQHHFLGKTSESALIADIKSVSFSSNLFLASIHLLYNAPLPKSIEMSNISIWDAQKAVNIIEGLVVTHHENLELTKIPKEVLVSQTNKIGDMESL